MQHRIKRIIALLAAAVLLFAVGSAREASAQPYAVAALKGPTAMGLVKLMHDSENTNAYDFTIAGSADTVTPALLTGKIDFACIPANLAAVLYNKTEGAICVPAINTLGVLYVVENGDSVQAISDLRGKTLVASGKGSTPEYALRHLLRENGVDPDRDITIEWKSEHAECVAALASGRAALALLPQPFVTAAQRKIEGLRTAIDLNAVWRATEPDSALITGVIVVRSEIARQNPDAVYAFLREYARSVNWVGANPADAAALIGEYGIVDASVAESALPYCNIVCVTGTEMKTMLEGYLRILLNANPTAVGGKMPDDDFYFE